VNSTSSNNNNSSSSSSLSVAEERGHFENPGLGERPPFEDVTRRLVKTRQTDKT
jgi:hypothetical protein